MGSTISDRLTVVVVAVVDGISVVIVVVVDGGGFSKRIFILVPVSSLTPHFTPKSKIHFSNLSLLSSLLFVTQHSVFIFILRFRDTWWEFSHTFSPLGEEEEDGGGSPGTQHEMNGFLRFLRALSLTHDDERKK